MSKYVVEKSTIEQCQLPMLLEEFIETLDEGPQSQFTNKQFVNFVTAHRTQSNHGLITWTKHEAEKYFKILKDFGYVKVVKNRLGW